MADHLFRAYSKVRFWRWGDLDAGVLFFGQLASFSTQKVNKLTDSDPASNQGQFEFILPPGSLAGQVSLTIEGKSSAWNLPLTIYDQNTPIQVTEKDGVVWAKNADPQAKLTLYFQNGQQMTVANPNQGINYPTEQKIISVKLVDNNNNPLPFFVEPAEFGF